LADTTLGEQTAGRYRPKKKKSPQQAVQLIDSFDENSLYTTPFSLQLDEASSYHLAMPSTPSTFSSQIVKPLDYCEGNILFPLSDTNTESSDGIYSAGQASGPISVDEGPIDLDTEEPYQRMEEGIRVGPIDLDTDDFYQGSGIESHPENDESRAQKASKAIEHGDLELNPHEMDEWSCDFEDFDRGTEFYEAEARSRSPSYSSKSTTKIGNMTSVLDDLSVPEAHVEFSYTNGEEEKREVTEGTFFSQFQDDENPSHHQRLSRSIRATESDDEESQKLYMDLMTDTQSLEKPTSPSSASSRKSLSSKRSASSWSSRESRKPQIGQPPLYPTTEGHRSKPKGHGDYKEAEKAPYQSPLSKLFDSFAFPKTPPHSHFIPVVTPEGEEGESEMEESTDTSQPRDSESDPLEALKDDVSASSVSTGMSPNPWLFDTVEQTLGPRSVTADMESLSGKSNLSVRSPGSRSRVGTAESVASFGSRFSGLTQSDISFAPRTFEHDLKRLEMQLAALDGDAMTTSSSVGASSVTGASFSSISSRNRAPKISRKKRIVVLVPPGKLGVILANRHDGKGTVVSAVRDHSSLKGMLSPGDKLVAVDGEDVTGMVVSQITSLMASKAERERRLTVITSVSAQQYSHASESKSEK
jgi:hypothetical protein